MKSFFGTARFNGTPASGVGKGKQKEQPVIDQPRAIIGRY
jgi:hypothetical protein